MAQACEGELNVVLHVKCQDFNRGFNMSYEAALCEATVHAIIGASGAGKSTLLSIVAGAM